MTTWRATRAVAGFFILLSLALASRAAPSS